MHKRRFLGTAALTSVLAPLQAQTLEPARTGPGLITISGAVGKTNRRALDLTTDRLLLKHGVRFERAWVVDAAALARMPAVQIRPTVQYDGQRHTLSGPLLTTVLESAGVTDRELNLQLRAIDGYAAQMSLADAADLRMIVATVIDGRPLQLGGLGPQWAVYDADSLPGIRERPLQDRFDACPWGLYSIEVSGG